MGGYIVSSIFSDMFMWVLHNFRLLNVVRCSSTIRTFPIAMAEIIQIMNWLTSVHWLNDYYPLALPNPVIEINYLLVKLFHVNIMYTLCLMLNCVVTVSLEFLSHWWHIPYTITTLHTLTMYFTSFARLRSSLYSHYRIDLIPTPLQLCTIPSHGDCLSNSFTLS